MTSKEFYRRLDAFIPLNEAAIRFSNVPDRDYIFKAVLFCFDRKVTQYVLNVSSFVYDACFTDTCMSLYFDRFTRKDFEIQYKYFVGFYNRCSQIQKDILRHTVVLEDLIAKLDAGKE